MAPARSPCLVAYGHGRPHTSTLLGQLIAVQSMSEHPAPRHRHAEPPVQEMVHIALPQSASHVDPPEHVIVIVSPAATLTSQVLPPLHVGVHALPVAHVKWQSQLPVEQLGVHDAPVAHVSAQQPLHPEQPSVHPRSALARSPLPAPLPSPAVALRSYGADVASSLPSPPSESGGTRKLQPTSSSRIPRCPRALAMGGHWIGKTQLPPLHVSGAQHCELSVQAPHVPLTHA
jgi:hypothetical protein